MKTHSKLNLQVPLSRGLCQRWESPSLLDIPKSPGFKTTQGGVLGETMATITLIE